MADESIQQQVNDAILQAGKIENRLSRMAVLMSSPVPLTVTYSAALSGDVLSVAILSSGALETERATQEWAAVNIDLRTGQTITLDDLFTDADEARTMMEDVIADEILPDMSAHLAAEELLPLPEVFSLTEYGLTLHYPIRRFETLSERAGTITFLWSELADVLDLSEDSVLTRLGVGKHLMLAADAKETLTAALSGGAFPGIPAALDDSVQGLIDTYQLLNDPDLAGDQRMISLEDGAFRNVYILTDNLTRKLDSSVAQSIRADRLMLLGLVTGSTTQDEWRQALGEPTRTVSVSAESAELRRLCAGQTDYYAWWSNATLCLHADENGVLRTVMLIQAENGEGN